MTVEYPGLPRIGPDLRVYLEKVRHVVNNALLGRTNNVKRFTLTANVASSVLTDPNIRAESAVIFIPVTANAAAELAAGTMWYADTSRTHETLTINHANNAQADRTFIYVVMG